MLNQIQKCFCVFFFRCYQWWWSCCCWLIFFFLVFLEHEALRYSNLLTENEHNMVTFIYIQNIKNTSNSENICKSDSIRCGWGAKSEWVSGSEKKELMELLSFAKSHFIAKRHFFFCRALGLFLVSVGEIFSKWLLLNVWVEAYGIYDCCYFYFPFYFFLWRDLPQQTKTYKY